MTAQSTQTQTTVNTTFAREVIDLQEEMRSMVRDVLNEREGQINASLAESKRILETATTQRQQATEQLRRRRQEVRKLSVDIQDALATLRAPIPAAP
jgi:predicted  nucleic acid-binding Zn-ribbon protein